MLVLDILTIKPPRCKYLEESLKLGKQTIVEHPNVPIVFFMGSLPNAFPWTYETAVQLIANCSTRFTARIANFCFVGQTFTLPTCIVIYYYIQINANK